MPATDTDPGDWGAVLRGRRRSRRLTLEDVAGVLDVGPERLALLEAGEVGGALDGLEAEWLLGEYARVLGLDGSIVRGWLADRAAAGAPAGSVSLPSRNGAGGPEPHRPAARRIDGPGRVPLTGAARFARPLSPAHPSGPSSTHTALKGARVRCGLSQEEAARLLEMRVDFVAAMDRGDLGRLPRGHAYGMLTRYAALVGLDPRLAVAGLAPPAGAAAAETRRSTHRVALWIRFAGGVLIVAGLILAAIGVS